MSSSSYHSSPEQYVLVPRSSMTVSSSSPAASAPGTGEAHLYKASHPTHPSPRGELKDEKKTVGSTLLGGSVSTHAALIDDPLVSKAPCTGESKDERSSCVSMKMQFGNVMRSMSGKGRGATYRVHVGTVATLTTGGGGVVNTVYSNTGIASSPEFIPYAALFDEFFIHSLQIGFEPLNQYMNTQASSFTAPVSGMLLLAPLYHEALPYTVTADMANNVRVKKVHSGRTWTYTWRNNEDPKSGVLAAPFPSSSIPCQGWCLTAAAAAALYSGQIQVRNNFAFSGAASSVLGDVLVRWDVTFRAKI